MHGKHLKIFLFQSNNASDSLCTETSLRQFFFFNLEKFKTMFIFNHTFQRTIYLFKPTNKAGM